MKVLQYGSLPVEAELNNWIRLSLIATKGCPKDNHQVMMLTGSCKALGFVRVVFLYASNELIRKISIVKGSRWPGSDL